MSRCGAAAINPVAVCRPAPPLPSSIFPPPSLENKSYPPWPRVPGWRHRPRAGGTYSCTLRARLHAAASNSGDMRRVLCIMYCVLLYLYIALSCVSMWWRDVAGCVCCSFYDSITCGAGAGRQLPPRQSPHRLFITPRPPSCMRSHTKLSAHTQISYWQAPRPWPSSFHLNPYPLAPSP